MHDSTSAAAREASARTLVTTLEREGIEKFVASVDRLLDHIRAKRDVLTPAA